ncbi:MAG: hypothetical protein ACHQWU_03900 [Gemmatimonadales bacterium]|jgi:hypothetical protein
MTTLRAGLAALVLAGIGMTLSPARSAAQKKQRDLLTRAEIQASAKRDDDLFSALRVLRPHFLDTAPGQVSFGASPVMHAIVYIDGRREPSVDGLHTIKASEVEEVRYLDPSQASIEYGPSASGGAVVIKMHKPSFGDAPGRPDTASLKGSRVELR